MGTQGTVCAAQPNVELWKLRVNAGLSRSDLGRLTGVSGKTIREVERGRIPGPRIQRAIAHYFGLESADLFPIEAQVLS